MASFTSAQKLILDALRMDGARLQAEMSEQDWKEFATLARMHRLGPMLHHRLPGGDRVIPRAVREQLHVSHRRHAMRNLKLYRELVTVARLLDDAGISFLALKGAYLARFAYPEPGLRPMRDLDLLLRPDDAVRAFSVLRANGYQSLFDGTPEAYFADRKHLPPLTGASGISIELHHRLTYPFSYLEFHSGFVDVLWSRSIAKEIGGTPVKFFCVEDQLLHLCVHATMEHLLNTGPLALTDVSWLAASHSIDWQVFLASVSEGNWQRCVLPLLSLAKRYLGAQIPEAVIRELGGGKDDSAWLDAAAYLLFSDPEDHKLLDFDVQDVLYTASLFRRLSALAGAVFPPRTTIARHFPVSAESAVAYLYYPRRWYRLVTGKLPLLLKAHSGREGAMRELALHRSTLIGWLKMGAVVGGHSEPK